MPARDKGCIAVSLVAEFAKLAACRFLLRSFFLNHLRADLLLMEALVDLLVVILSQLWLLLIEVLPLAGRHTVVLHAGILIFHGLVLGWVVLVLLLHEVLLFLVLDEAGDGLVLLRSLFVDHGHRFQVCNVWALDHEYGRPDLNYVAHF